MPKVKKKRMCCHDDVYHWASLTLFLILVVPVVASREQHGQAPLRTSRATRSNCSQRKTTAKVKVDIQTLPEHVGSSPMQVKPGTNKVSDNFEEGKEGNKYEESGGGNGGPTGGGTGGESPDQEDCDDHVGPEVSVSIPDEFEGWKTKVIIACTVAAAVEIIIIIVIVAYWREIRWTMRKLSCPCDERPSRHGDHEAMERTDATTLTVSTPESHNLMENDLDDSEGQSQMFRHPRRSRTQEALDEVLDGEDVTRV